MSLTFPLPVDHLVLTVNNRLKRHLELLDADARKNEGQIIWPTAPIFPINSWLKETYQTNWPDRWVLSSLQSQTLWENLLESDREFMKLDPLTLRGAAKEATKAYSLLHQYEIPFIEKGFSGTEETSSFYRWKTAYEAALKQQGALDSSLLMKRLEKMIASNEITLPRQIIFAGFDEIIPALKSFIQVLQSSGHEVQFFPEINKSNSMLEQGNNSNIAIRRFSDLKTEVIQCARWVRENFQEGSRIGIVATRLDEVKALLERELMAELAPESIFPWENIKLPFNVSLGQPLIKETMFPPVLTLLASADKPTPFVKLLQVLRSPYLVAEADNENVVDDLETRLVKKKTPDVTLATLRSLTLPAEGKNQRNSLQYKSVKALLAKWIEYQQNKKYQSRKLPSEWARIFVKTLSSIGWPAKSRSLNSREIQAYLEWENRLDELATLDPIKGNISRVEAADYLFGMVANPARPFQEQSTEDSPVQLMGLLESSGQSFDCLWVMGCDADVLPEPLRPNPFIPANLQRKLELPYASPERQYSFSKTLIARLSKAAQNVVFSYSALKDKEPKRPSPLLSELPEQEILSEISYRIKDRITTLPLENFPDATHLPINNSLLSGIQGGYGILKNQAECPFRAFSIHRLLADRYLVAETDFEYMERGNIIHFALELVWKQIKTRENLERLSQSDALENLIKQVMNEIMLKEDFSRILKNQSRFREMEIERVTSLVLDWLNFELSREDFKVTAIEKKEKFEFEGMVIRFRADRIDELPNGQKILIDYKSGKVMPGAWFKEPVRDPQLPLYATHLNPDGIALAQVRKGEFNIHTAGSRTIPFKGLKELKYQKETACENWEELRNYWDNQLKTLALKFKEGELVISPVEDDATCRNCLHASFCRVDELKQRLTPYT